MSEVYLIDYYSNSINSFFHRRTVLSKAVLLLLIFLSVISSKSFHVFLFVFLNLIIISLISKIPLKMIGKWSFYPIIFTSIFALSQINQGWLPLITLFRALIIAFAVMLFFCITPYSLVFSKISRLSSFFSSMFLLTYRYFFLIIEEIETRFQMMKVRGGTSGGLVRSVINVGKLIGVILISLIERGEKMYGLLLIRGYNGRIYSRTKEKFSYLDVIVISWGLVIFILSSLIL